MSTERHYVSWQKSRGAQLEHQVATATGMRIYGARA